MSDFNLLIKNGTIIDGSGRTKFKGDIGVSDGKIIEIGDLGKVTGDKVIDAKDRFVSPGFIDNHAHSDWTILVHPTGDSKVMQGVTTEVGGLCGYAAAPINREEWWKLLYVRMTVGWSMHYSAAAYNSWPLPYGRQLDVDWSTMAEYLERLEKTGIGLNYGMLFGHGSIRYYAMGLEARKAEEHDLDEMKKMARQAMEEGAFGMSSGLSGCPGCWADTEELIELNRVVKRYNGVYMPHMRSSYLQSSVEESIEIAEKSGVRTCMSHTRRARKDGKNLDARIDMSTAATLAGIAFGHGGVHLEHSIGHVLGVKNKVPHGFSCTMLMPEILEFISSVKLERIVRIGEMLGVNTNGMSLEEAGVAAISAVKDLMNDVGAPSLADYGIYKEDIPALTDKCKNEMWSSPKPIEASDFEQMFRKAIIR